MVSPHDTEELAEKLSMVLTDKDLRERMVREGYERVKHFNWYRVARNTLAVYYEVYQNARNGTDSWGQERKFVPFDVWEKFVEMENNKLDALVPE